MNENPTICINCKHFSKANYSVALNKYWYHALCVHPDLILKEYNYVIGEESKQKNPYCRDINKDGNCKHYEAK